MASGLVPNTERTFTIATPTGFALVLAQSLHLDNMLSITNRPHSPEWITDRAQNNYKSIR